MSRRQVRPVSQVPAREHERTQARVPEVMQTAVATPPAITGWGQSTLSLQTGVQTLSDWPGHTGAQCMRGPQSAVALQRR